MRKFLRLSWHDKGRALEAFGAVAVARFLLVGFSFRQTMALTALLDRRWTARGTGNPAQTARLSYLVRRVSRAVPGATCLPQAVALKWMLARRRIACRLRIGVRHGPDGAFQAHAWLETSSGEVILGGAQSPAQYKPLPFETARFR